MSDTKAAYASQQLNHYSMVQHELPEVPRQVRIETSSLCSMKCSWCHLHGDFVGQPREKRLMDLELFDLLLEDIASWPQPLFEMVPTNFGELFMNKDWPYILKRISQRLPRTQIKLVTTGTMLNESNLEQLALVPTLSYVNFSLNAFFGETWSRIHKVPEKVMPKVIEAIHTFRDRRPDVQVNVSMVQDPDITTELEADLFLNHWAQFGPVTVSSVSYAGNPNHQPDPPVTLSCRSVVDGLAIFDDGTVSHGCCFNGNNDPDLRIGHFPEESLLDIWRGEKLASFLELHNSGRRSEINLCRSCNFA